MSKKNQQDQQQDQGQDQAEVQQVEAEQPSEETNELNREVSDQDAQVEGQDGEKRVANNGEVSDPGNSGLIGEAFTEGSVTGQADKPNG